VKPAKELRRNFFMFTITLDPIIFSVGHLHIRWYSLIILTAIVVGVWLVAREAARKGFKKEDIYDSAIWIVFGGLLGARLFHVLDHWSDTFASNPIRALYIWEGGLAIWGGVAGGLLEQSWHGGKAGGFHASWMQPPPASFWRRQSGAWPVSLPATR
jgi:prolipoprotein diacylglyceryltransferase